ncbi:MAG: flagellar FlbD family protein [Spirochaetia bacterium]|nr:flagellar FlbD family protein [Spirochaetia bacterium]
MILVTRLDNKKIVVNGDLIEVIESTPETLLTLTTGKKVIVKETVEQIVEMVKKYKRETALPVVKDNENL